jgi:predicted secreted protein
MKTALFPLLCLLLINCNTFAASQQSYNQVTLHATASSEVSNNLMVVTLVVQKNGANVSQLTQQVNKSMTEVLTLAGKKSSIKSKTTRFNSRPIQHKGKIQSWQVQQYAQFSSENFNQLGSFIAQTNELAHIQSIQFQISHDLKDTTKTTLTKRAISMFTQKANMVTKQFGKSGYKLVQISIDDHHRTPQPMYMESRALGADAIAPAVAAGTGTVTVTVNGTIEMHD